MLQLNDITLEDFLTNYWQKKPFLFKQGFSTFQTPLAPEELAGLAMEDEFESRLVLGDVSEKQNWQLKTGPFSEQFLSSLPEKNWTLLVNGVDRFIPEVAALQKAFDFLPQWRADDVMVSYATTGGSVGPHFDVYDVFLLQGKGRRQWNLTTKDCHEENYELDIPLRLMKKFDTEQVFVLEEGDVLYIPPYIGHHGVSLDNECMTYSFGYRSYDARELWDSFGEYISDHGVATYYKDPKWLNLKSPGQITKESIEQASAILKQTIDNPELFQKWFGQFVTTLDQQAQTYFFEDEPDEQLSFGFEEILSPLHNIERNPLARFAYLDLDATVQLFINGEHEKTEGINPELIQHLCDNRLLKTEDLMKLNLSKQDQQFLYELCQKNLLLINEIL